MHLKKHAKASKMCASAVKTKAKGTTAWMNGDELHHLGIRDVPQSSIPEGIGFPVSKD